MTISPPRRKCGMNPMIGYRDTAGSRIKKIWEGTCPILREEGEILMMCRVGPTPIAILKELPRVTGFRRSASHTTGIGQNRTLAQTCSSLPITNKILSNAERALKDSRSIKDSRSHSTSSAAIPKKTTVTNYAASRS